MKFRIITLLPVCVCLFLAVSARAQIISTLNSSIYGYGGSSVGAGWGETFVVPSGGFTNVASFTMDLPNSNGLFVNGYLAQYTGNSMNPGTALWSGAVQSTGSLVTFNVGGLTLDPSKTYAIWNSAVSVNFSDAVTNNTSAYASGGAIFVSSSGVSDLTANYDLLFAINFGAPSPVPEASTYAMGGLLLCGLLAVHQRRRKAGLTPAA